MPRARAPAPHPSPGSDEDIGRGLRPQNVLDPPVEDRGVVARLYAGAVLLRERDPGPRVAEHLQLAVAEPLQLAVAEPLQLAVAEALELAGVDEPLHEGGKRRLAFD